MRIDLLSLARCERGASLIEMALAVPILAAVLIGMVDISRAYSEKLQLEQAAQRAIDKVLNRQTDNTSFGALKAEAAEAALIPEEDVGVDYWLECDGVRQSQYDAACGPGQIYTRHLSVEVQKNFEPLFGTKYFPGANSDGTYTIKAKAGLRIQ